MTVFGRDYSSAYDLLYRDKDYDAECDRIERIIRDHHKGVVRTVLDLGCGTGNHVVRLAGRGYSVTGVDRSGDMLDIARLKARNSNFNCTFVQSDIRTFRSKKKFDVVIMMFAVLGYQIGNADIEQALATVQRHLKPGGLFVCDVWYGPAVLHQKPGDRVRITNIADTTIIRVSSGNLDSYRHVVDVHFQVWKIVGDRVTEKIREDHRMRFFFPQEIAGLMKNAGLDLTLIRDFDDITREPDENSWNIWVVGKNPQPEK
jgi:SAM-dependent methyltransferase